MRSTSETSAETLQYTQEDVISEIRERYPEGVEGLVDLVNFADGFAQLAEVVAPGGRAASLLGAADEEQLAARDVRATNVIGIADPALLNRLAKLVDSGEIRIPEQHVYPLEEATEGLDVFDREHTRGKLAISVATV